MNLNLLKSRDSDSGFTDRRDSHESLAKPPSAAIGMMLSRRIVECADGVVRSPPRSSTLVTPLPRLTRRPCHRHLATSTRHSPRRASAGLHCSNEVALSLPTSLVALADAS